MVCVEAWLSLKRLKGAALATVRRRALRALQTFLEVWSLSECPDRS